MPRPAKVRLAVPRSPALGARGVPIHWQREPGDAVEPKEVLATLDTGTELCAPEGLSGRIDKLLASEGERVINRQPLVRISVSQSEQNGPAHDDVPAGPGGLEEQSAVPFEGLPSRIVMEPVDKRTHRRLVVLGGITVLGLAVAVLCLPIYLIVGGPAVPAVGGVSLAIVAAALAYGERILHKRNG